MLINKEIIKNNFSKYARYYDRYSNIQNLCAARLIAKVKEDGFLNILDIGCGTGNYTRLLRARFPKARIKAIDISKEMVRIAKEKLQSEEIEFIVADGEKLDFKKQFDFISSNASLQWFEDLEKTLSGYKRLLKKNGIISFSIFGPRTFYELDKSLKELSGKCVSTSSCNFIKRKELTRFLKGIFRETKVEQQIYKERHHSLKELLKKIKYTGTRGNGTDNKGLWTPKTMYDLEKIYRKRHKGIIATYQVFFCKGKR